MKRLILGLVLTAPTVYGQTTVTVTETPTTVTVTESGATVTTSGDGAATVVSVGTQGPAGPLSAGVTCVLGEACTFTIPILAPAFDNCAAPPYSFTGDTTTGFCSSADGVVHLRSNGANALSVSGTANTLQIGADAAIPFNQFIMAPDATSTNTAGATLYLMGGDGTVGNADGGSVILRGGVNAGSGEEGSVQIMDTGTKPTCSALIRGAIWYDAGGVDVADTFEVCRKDAANDYAWAALF